MRQRLDIADVEENPAIVEIGDEVEVQFDDGGVSRYALVHPAEVRAAAARKQTILNRRNPFEAEPARLLATMSIAAAVYMALRRFAAFSPGAGHARRAGPGADGRRARRA